jgi:NhaA family Na+:H+ antiporter
MNIPARSRGIVEKRAERSYIVRKALLPVQALIEAQEVSAALLLAAAVAALLWANSPWSPSYFHLWETVITVDVGFFRLSEDLHHWINDGLMALFFFQVGLEIKRELVEGELSRLQSAALPVAGAVGGMLLPALIYLLLNAGSEGARGWGIPMATDIAFALGVLALLGDRIPAPLRIFLLALATVDDIGAILVIAVFYTQHLSLRALGVATLILGVIVTMRQIEVRNVGLYVLAGALFWVAVQQSGIHATIAGVILGLLTPHDPWFGRVAYAGTAETLLKEYREALAEGDENRADAILGQLEELTEGTEGPLERIERQVRPWVGYLVMPLFALANSGVPLASDMLRDAAASPITLGVLLGLLAGKLAGVLVFAWTTVRVGIAALPEGVSWPHVAGAGLLAGIGFTVSLFITGLAFTEARLIAEAKIGILAASLLAGISGYLFLRFQTQQGSRVKGVGAANSSRFTHTE